MNNLITVLNYGSLPFPLKEESDTEIGATLAGFSLDRILLAAAIGSCWFPVHARLLPPARPGCVMALIYYALLVLAIFRLIPVTLTLAGIAGFVLSIGMAVDANILIFERMKEELRSGKMLNSAHGGRLQPGLELHPRLERVHPDHRDDPVSLRVGDDPRLRTGPDHRRALLDVHRDHRDPDDPAPGWSAKSGRGYPGSTGCAKRSSPLGRSWRVAARRRAPVLDIIGKRNWFFLFSA